MVFVRQVPLATAEPAGTRAGFRGEGSQANSDVTLSKRTKKYLPTTVSTIYERASSYIAKSGTGANFQTDLYFFQSQCF